MEVPGGGPVECEYEVHGASLRGKVRPEASREGSQGHETAAAELGPVRLRIRLAPGASTTGGIVWNAAKVLLHILGTEGGIRVADRRVMDLGSGTGVLGLACSAMGASRVVLTDMPQQLPLLQDNVSRNMERLPAGSVTPEVEPLMWGNEVAHLEPPFDLVLCSDLVFCAHNAGCLPALLQSILDLSESHTEVVVAFQERLGWIESRFIDEVKTHFSKHHEIDVGEAVLQKATAQESEEEFEGMGSMFREDIGMHVYVFSDKKHTPPTS